MEVTPIIQDEVETSQSIGDAFEEEVRLFLRDVLKLQDVKGGRTFSIAPPGVSNQIDACARFENVLFIFECKASGRTTNRSMRNDIKEAYAHFSMASDNYKRIDEYKHCTKVRFIFITRRRHMSDGDWEYLKSFDHPPVYYASEQTLEYYSDLQKKIGKYALYNFLAEFRIRPLASDTVDTPAIKTSLGHYEAYSFLIEPNKLLKYCYVARRRRTEEDSYQRMLESGRIKGITAFLNAGGAFPTNIVLSIQHPRQEDGPAYHSFRKLDGQPGSEFGVLTIGGSYDACWIVDGQHRLYAYASSQSTAPVPCLALVNVSPAEERKFFLEINREQRRIQSDLIWDLDGVANPNSLRGVISNCVKLLDKWDDSPFYGSVYIPANGSTQGKAIKLSAFCDGISNSGLMREILPNAIGGEGNALFDDNKTLMSKRTARVLARYFRMIKETADESYHSLLLGNAGVPVLLYVLEPIVAYIGRVPGENDLKPYVESIAEYFATEYPTERSLRKLRQELNSEGARKLHAKNIGGYLKRQLLLDEQFWPTGIDVDSVDYAALERQIGRLIASKLSVVSTVWQEQRVPSEILPKVTMLAQRNQTPFEDNLTLGQEKDIIIKRDNWREIFESVFTRDRNRDFRDQAELVTAFDRLTSVRNALAHGSRLIESSEYQQFQLYSEKLGRILDDNLQVNEDADYAAESQ